MTRRRDAPNASGPVRAGDAGAGHEDDAVAGQPHAQAEVEAGIHGAQAGVESAERVPHRAAHQHAAGGDAEHVGAGVVLGLVQFALDQVHGGAEWGQGLAEVGEHVGLFPAQEFGSGHGHRRGDFDGGEQFGQRGRFRGVVLGEQPEPLVIDVRHDGRGDAEGAGHGGREADLAGHLDELGGPGCGEQRARIVGRAGVDGDHGVGPVGLRGEGGESPRKELGPRAGNEDHSNSRLHLVETRRGCPP